MKLTEKDVELFRVLHDSEQGVRLVDYLERLQKEIGYLPESIEVAKKTIEAIQTHLINKIQLQTENKKSDPNQFFR